MGDTEKYTAAENALLVRHGIDATASFVQLRTLGGEVRVLEVGEGPVVLFVPGVMTGGAVFAGLVSRTSGYRCIMIDRPGVGLSPLLASSLSGPPDHERVADRLLVDLLDGLGVEQGHIVSTSLGGWTALRSVAAHPGRFGRMVGMGYQVGARMEKAPLSMRAPAIPWLMPRRVKATPRIVRTMLKSAGMRAAIKAGKFDDEMIDWMVALLRHTDTFRNESLRNPRPVGPRGPSDEVRHSADLLAKVTIPVHLLWGTDDLFGGEASASELASLLPDASLQMVEGAGHAPWIDEPDLAVEAVQHHLVG